VSTSAELTVIAHYRVQPGRGDEVAEVLRKHLAVTRAEPGNLGFAIHRSTADPDEFALVERFDGQESLDAHVASDHYAQNVTGLIRPLLVGRTVAVYTDVEP
jgi:quinol monooxygenase YgiN